PHVSGPQKRESPTQIDGGAETLAESGKSAAFRSISGAIAAHPINGKGEVAMNTTSVQSGTPEARQARGRLSPTVSPTTITERERKQVERANATAGTPV